MLSATATNVASGQSTYTQNFTYNAIGNITSSPVGSYTYTGTGYANPHAATSINSVTNTYDNDGNVLTDGTLTNTWSYKDQLSTSTNGTFTRTYLYDESGNRVSSSDGTTTTVYPNKFYNYDGTKKTKSIYAGDQLVATVETVGAVVTPYYDHIDQLNSVVAVSNSSGGLSETLDYYPYGSQRINSGSYNSQRRALGQMYDTDTMLNYYQARYQNGVQGRFISQDSMFWSLPDSYLFDPQQQNSYLYGRGNPITNSDPSGNASIIGAVKSFFKSLFGKSSNGVSSSSATMQKPTSTSVTMVNYSGSNFTGKPVQANPNFINGLKEVNRIAQNNNVMVNVTSSGVRSPFVKVGGAIVQQSDRSNHYTGSAIDMNVISGETGKNCNSTCLGGKQIPNDVSGFIKDVSSSQTLRWGGEWAGKNYDPVHIDNGFNVNNFNGWKQDYQLIHGIPYKE